MEKESPFIENENGTRNMLLAALAVISVIIVIIIIITLASGQNETPEVEASPASPAPLLVKKASPAPPLVKSSPAPPLVKATQTPEVDLVKGHNVLYQKNESVVKGTKSLELGEFKQGGKLVKIVGFAEVKEQGWGSQCSQVRIRLFRENNKYHQKTWNMGRRRSWSKMDLVQDLSSKPLEVKPGDKITMYIIGLYPGCKAELRKAQLKFEFE